ncbi:MAG: sugar phosphate nucleotidyltransferase [Alicyclobacillaceae bacterium]|nr:sugar phosphate nucleotidyltransferase [Alicyclobacillaceae bacterium]
MKAIIMAGGKGSRLRPLTCNLPKPMVPLLDRPCMEYIINLLKEYGITEIGVTVQYLASVIKGYFGDGGDFGVRLHYFEERTPLGTAGSVKNAEGFLDEPFLVVSGDALTDFDLGEAIRVHRNRAALATIVLTRVDVPLEYGVVMTDENGLVTRFLEKPSWSEVFSDTVNTGIYVLNPEILQLVEKGKVFDFSKDLFPMLMAQGLPLYGHVANGYWSDIGNLAQYRRAQFDLLHQRVKAKIKGRELRAGVWIDNGSQIDPTVELEAPVYIGEGSTISAHAKIGPDVVLGRYNQIGQETVVVRSVLWNRNYVANAASLTDASVCNNVNIGVGVDVCEDSVIGDKTQIGDMAVIRPGVKIWPEKRIGEGTIQQTSLIWASSMFASLFGEDGISGIPNLELIPEMVSRVAAAYGSGLPRNSTVSVSCDENAYCGILKFAVMSSLMAIGVKVRDIGTAPVPVARFECRRSDSAGGIHIRSVGDDANNGDKRIVLQFFDEDGLPIDKATERNIENAFFQEDFARPGAHGLGGMEYRPQILDFYVQEVLSRVPIERVRQRAFRVVFQCDSPHVLSVMLPILDRLGCSVVTMVNSDRDIGQVVLDNRADLGIVLRAGGQEFRFSSETGYTLSADEVLILQMLIAVKERMPLAMPVTAPSVLEEMSAQVGIPVVRTKTVLRSLLEVGMQNDLQVHFDGFYAVVAALQFLVEEGIGLQEFVEQLPKFHMRTETVPCPIEAKGRVMRRLMEDMKGQRLELIDGIKVLTDDGWALIMPDSQRAMFKVVAQGITSDKATELTSTYMSKISDYQLA